MILTDEIVSALLALPKSPAKPLVGPGFARVNFPHRRTDVLRRLWAAIPDAHKDRMQQSISPEAFDAIRANTDNLL